jgi:ATP-dependent RNA helicase DeaD
MNGLKVNDFNSLNIDAQILKAINELGYTTPSPIQTLAIPVLLGEPNDFIGLAATGTGKTAAFSIPLLNQIPDDTKSVSGLVLCPTRELAQQVSNQITLLGKFKNISALCIYGGGSYSDQMRGLKMGAKVVVGTPGRIIDHIKRGTLKLDQLKTIVLDEADEMVSMGFKEELEEILEASKDSSRNIWLFSATMSPGVRKIADGFLKSPEFIQVNKKEVLSENITQLFYPVRESDKPDILCKVLETTDDFYGLVFCQTKALVSDLTQTLQSRGYKVDCLHGDKSQGERERTMKAFRDRKITILVCTDVASRGIDVKDLTHVINYSVPRELDVYIHRIGRTARSGKSGTAISLITPAQRGLLARIESRTKSKIPEGKIPSRKEVGIKKTSKILAKFQNQKNHQLAIELLDDSWKESIANMTNQEIVGRFLNMLAPDIFELPPERPFQQRPFNREHSGSDRRFDRRPDRRSGSFGERRYRDNSERSDRRPSGDRPDRRNESSEGRSDFRNPRRDESSEGRSDFKRPRREDSPKRGGDFRGPRRDDNEKSIRERHFSRRK